MEMKITRHTFRDIQTLGKLEVFERVEYAKDPLTLQPLTRNQKIFECKTLELEEDTNQQSDDCIPKGTYKVKKRTSAKYKKHFHVLNVPNRSYILIHNGNYHTHTRGCILVGRDHVDINNDGYKDVTSSKTTLRELYALMPNEFELEII